MPLPGHSSSHLKIIYDVQQFLEFILHMLGVSAPL